jgi:hypothetical protein
MSVSSVTFRPSIIFPSRSGWPEACAFYLPVARAATTRKPCDSQLIIFISEDKLTVAALQRNVGKGLLRMKPS